MRKLIVLIITAVLAVGLSCASGIQEEYDMTDGFSPGRSMSFNRQGNEGRSGELRQSMQHWNMQKIDLEKASVNGTIKLNEGFATVNEVAGGNSYIVPILNRFSRFTDEVKDGAAVYIEGFVFERNERKFLHPVELTIEGKLIEFPNMALMAERASGWSGASGRSGASGWNKNDLPRNREGDAPRGMYSRENHPNRENRPDRTERPNNEEPPFRGSRGRNKTS